MPQLSVSAYLQLRFKLKHAAEKELWFAMCIITVATATLVIPAGTAPVVIATDVATIVTIPSGHSFKLERNLSRYA